MTKRILIVDDSAVMRKNLKSILSRAGYEVVAEATNGEEAVRAYADYKPDLVTMDVTMPVLNGIEAVKRIVAADREAKIVVVSAFDQRSMLFEAMENGASHYIIKPITSDKLLAVVDKLLEGGNTDEDSSEDAAGPSVSAEAGAAGDGLGGQPAQEPFTIENREGKFVITLSSRLHEEAISSIRAAMQGLLFIKPLSVAFYFRDIAAGTEVPYLSSIEEMVASIRQAGGRAEFIADREDVVLTLRSRWSDIETSLAGR
ncbi:response regulator [Paenibacillus mesophilus]|uniref:response regulator n=1 Tax=Paenibacillus mesophilus TaxID=2582849 RepID=UPI00110E8A64|nr:response regulator [Paenibacillus mesophilus]TMV50768.1 response regulator [Paenibacillus mesophilus]